MNVVKVDNHYSECFPVNRGVKQGSVLSPTLFTIVVDSLLKNLDATGQGLCISGLDLGASAHADDIRAISNFPEAAEIQGRCIGAFCTANSLTLNTSKTEAVAFTNGPHILDTIYVAGQSIQTQPSVKCLGVWLQHDLCRSIEENIAKARKAFFATGALGSFQGKSNPLTGRSIFVIPILLYGCETWILTPALTTKLEKFQSEIGKRILRLSKYHSDLAPLVGLRVPSIKARVLLRKLTFLAKLLESEDNHISTRGFRTLSVENVYNISLVDQCNSLQNDLGVDSVLQQCLAEPTIASAIVRSEKTRILEQDWATTLEVAKQHQSLRYIVCSDSVAANWCRLWDQALDLGTKGTKLTQNLFYSLCQPIFADRQCHYCENRIPSGENVFDHLCNAHLHKPYNENMVSILDAGGKTVLDMAAVISKFHYQHSAS
jgi:hypothetical protein